MKILYQYCALVNSLSFAIFVRMTQG